MKQKQTTISQSGFTVIELLVVFVIMVTVFVVVLVGFNRQRITRSTVIAQNEMVTNLRKIQSYMLSSRNIGTTGKAASFYIMRFQSGSGQYTVQAVGQESDGSYTFYDNLETIRINDTVTVSGLSLTNRGGTTSTPSCVQIIFAAPFGKVYIDTVDSSCGSNIVNTLRDPGVLATKADAKLTITLRHSQGASTAITKTIDIFGLSGRVVGN